MGEEGGGRRRGVGAGRPAARMCAPGPAHADRASGGTCTPPQAAGRALPHLSSPPTQPPHPAHPPTQPTHPARPPSEPTQPTPPSQPPTPSPMMTGSVSPASSSSQWITFSHSSLRSPGQSAAVRGGGGASAARVQTQQPRPGLPGARLDRPGSPAPRTAPGSPAGGVGVLGREGVVHRQHLALDAARREGLHPNVICGHLEGGAACGGGTGLELAGGEGPRAARVFIHTS
jgi:hypothetical protein